MNADRNPFDELDRLFDRLNRPGGTAPDPWSRGWERPPETAFPVDVEDRGETVVVTADLPGFEREEISVRVTDSRLSIRAEEEDEEPTGEGRYVRNERSHRSARRSVGLPGPVEPDSGTARYNNGVLTVTLTKAPGERDTTVEVT